MTQSPIKIILDRTNTAKITTVSKVTNLKPPSPASGGAATLVQGPRGPQGPIGPQGPTGLSAHVHNQNSPSTTWMITHNLNKFPNVVTTDFGGEVFYGTVNHLDMNVTAVTFTSLVSGKAYLS